MSATPAAVPASPAPAAPPAIRIEDYTRLVRWEIKQRYSRKMRVGVDLDDMYVVGLAALHRAAQTFDPTRSSFTTYALQWIRAKLNREIAQHGHVVRIPVHEIGRRWHRGQYPWPSVKSLAAPIRSDIGSTLEDVLASDAPAPDADLERKDSERQLQALIAHAGLTERETRVLNLRAREATLDAIAEELDCSRERVRQVEVEALRKLRAAAGSSATGGLAVYLGTRRRPRAA